MTFDSSGPATVPTATAPQRKLLAIGAILAAVSAILLIDTELVTVSGATVWAAVSLLHLSMVPAIIVACIIGVPTLWAAAYIAVLVFRTETRPDSDGR